jgi:hypothetical protein
MMTAGATGGTMSDEAGEAKIISWRTNKVRWVVFEYLNGLVLACVVFFAEQMFFPLELPRLVYEVLVLAAVPALFVAASILGSRERGES